jgi:hypothetical protein
MSEICFNACFQHSHFGNQAAFGIYGNPDPVDSINAVSTGISCAHMGYGRCGFNSHQQDEEFTSFTLAYANKRAGFITLYMKDMAAGKTAVLVEIPW